jgi:hypothetical protein
MLIVLGLSVSAAGQTVEIKRAEGQARFAIESSASADLSGIVWTGDDSFAAVSDKRNVIQFLTLQIDRASGEITGGRFEGARDVPGRVRDFEGIAWVTAAKTFYISAEEGHSVIRLVSGAAAPRTVPVPEIFAKARPNLSLESLTWNDTARQFWIANEEALRPDGPLSSRETGTLVRMQKFDAKFKPLAQYAWRTEPAAFRYGNAGSGVSDLCLLPDGQLIVLERGFAEGGLHLRLFLANFARATDITRMSSLDGADFIAARKTLLFEETTGFINFEGITLGPPLAGGWRSLIVVADSNSTSTHSFLALKVRLVSPGLGEGATHPGVSPHL